MFCLCKRRGSYYALMLYIKYMVLYFKGVLLGTYVEKHMFKIIFFFFVCFLFKYELTLLLFVALFHASLTSSLPLIMEIAIYVKLSLYFNSINYLNI